MPEGPGAPGVALRPGGDTGPCAEATLADFQPYRGDRYLSWPELVDWCEQAAQTCASLVQMSSCGQSRQGRPILLMRLGSADPRAPSLWIDGGTHCAEWAGVMSALYSLSRWVEALLAGDRELQEWFSCRAVVVVPCISPDGYAAMLEGAPYLRSTLRPPQGGLQRRGWEAADLDGDGVVRWLRLRHPAGTWVEEGGRMRPRRLQDPAAEAWVVMPEGRFVRWDGASWTDAPLEHGLDLNRNFPGSWERFEQFGMDGGEYPLSEPEARHVVEAFRARPGIAAAITNHTYTGCLLTQPYRDPSPLSRSDVELMELLAQGAVEGTGWRCIRTCPDFMYDRKKPIVGVWADTMANLFGVPGYTLELWDPWGEAGVSIADPAGNFVRPRPEDLARLLERFETEPGTMGWGALQHPQLGAVEVGGIDLMRTVRNPPLSLLPRELEKARSIHDRLRMALPELRASFHVEQVGAGLWRASLLLESLGFLPTSGLARAEELGLDRGIQVELRPGEGLALVEGELQQQVPHLDGWGSAQVGPAASWLWLGLGRRGPRAQRSWLLAGQGRVEVAWACQRAGAGLLVEVVGPSAEAGA